MAMATVMAGVASSSTFAAHEIPGLSLSNGRSKRSSVFTVSASASTPKSGCQGRRAATLGVGIALVSTIAASRAGANPLVEELLARSAANKELNDKKRLATSGANVARAYTVQFGTCQFPYNFTGCQDLAKTKSVKFLTDDLKLECEGKDKYKCGSNVFWKW